MISNTFPFAVAIAASQGFLAVALGAFGSHGLKARLSETMLSVWQTAVQYHFYHALALLALALYWHRQPISSWWQVSFWCFCTGLCLFCGSLYALAVGGPRWLGPVTPLGGLAFLVAWLMLIVGVLRG